MSVLNKFMNTHYNYKRWAHQFPRSTAAKKFEDTRPVMEQHASDMSEFQ